jgi:hypothetical protein
MSLKNCYMCERDLELERFNPKRKECKDCSVVVKLMNRYGITKEQYDQMLELQDGHCAICSATPDEVGTLCVDHDHSCCPGERTCGKCLRALLCPRCNTAIGLFDDDVERIQNAGRYVEFFKFVKSIRKDMEVIDEF